MGFWRDSWRYLTLQNVASRAQFSHQPITSPYMPIDQMFLAMYRGMGRVSREDALSIPGVLRARNMICGIATLPLQQLDSKNNVVPLPLLEQIDPDIPNVVTLGQTVEDLLFEGISWWRILEKDANNFPIYAQHLQYSSVQIQQDTTGQTPAPLPGGYDPRRSVVYVDGVEVPWSELRRFDSPNPPLLVAAGRSIRNAIAYDKAAAMYARNPKPADYFSVASGTEEPTDDQIRQELDLWNTARQSEATGYVRLGLQYNTVDSPSPRDLQLVELQDKVARDIAVATGLDASDLGVSVSSDTYANKVDRRQDRVNDVYSPYMKAITDRLSMPDTTRRGRRVVHDLDDYMRADPLTRMQVYTGYLAANVITRDEVRKEEKLPELTDDQRAELTPAPAEPAEPTEQVDAGAEDEEVPDNVRPLRQAAGGGRLMTFESDAPVQLRLNFTTAQFNVDTKTRTIEGIVVPYGRDKLAFKDGRWWRFEQGSMRYTERSRNKLLRDHDFNQPLGPMVHDEERPEGRFARYSVGRGPDGDRALMEAEDKVRDGFSVGVDILKYQADPLNKGALLVTDAVWFETSVLAVPAFDDARATRVAASRDQGETVEPDTTSEPTQAPAAPAPVPAAVDMNALFAQFMQQHFASAPQIPTLPPVQEETAAVINPTRNRTALAFIRESQPYRFDRGGNFVPGQQHVFSADLHEMAQCNDVYGVNTEAGRRVMGLLKETFSQIVSTDINELNPNIQRPDMYVDQRDYPTPLWNFVNRGAPPNGIQPFTFPKFSSSSGLVGDHTEGTEPTPGTFVTTSQTVTPTPLSGKANITREVWDMGGNPAVSTLIFNQMVRGYREGLESATATFLATLTAAEDINLGVGTVDDALQDAWDSAVADLQFIRRYDFQALALEKWLYKAFVAAKDSDGRKLYPIINPQNANGQASTRFRQLDLSGIIGIPTWALGAVSGSANNSWLFDPSTVYGWATAPQRLEFPGGGSTGTSYQPVASVDLAIWGYKAHANTDIGGVRQVIYDTN